MLGLFRKQLWSFGATMNCSISLRSWSNTIWRRDRSSKRSQNVWTAFGSHALNSAKSVWICCTTWKDYCAQHSNISSKNHDIASSKLSDAPISCGSRTTCKRNRICGRCCANWTHLESIWDHRWRATRGSIWRSQLSIFAGIIWAFARAALYWPKSNRCDRTLSFCWKIYFWPNITFDRVQQWPLMWVF